MVSLGSIIKDGSVLTIPLRKPEATGLFIIDVEGLGYPSATINIVEGPGHDGGFHDSSSGGVRTVTMTIGVSGLDGDVELARRQLYKFFPPNDPIELVITTDHLVLSTVGYIEDGEQKIFNKVSHGVIAILCPSTYLTDVEKKTIIFSGIVDGFEFPFSNESLTENLINFGDIVDYISTTIVYPGDAPTGIEAELTFYGETGDIRLYNTREDQRMVIDIGLLSDIIGGPTINGDVILIDTRVGTKSVIFVRGGIKTNILNTVGIDVDWLTLYSGDNPIVFSSSEGQDNVSLKIEYSVLYGGA